MSPQAKSFDAKSFDAKSFHARPSMNRPFDVAVLIRTTLRPSLARAVRSVFAQAFPGRVQILVGPDGVEGAEAALAPLRAECPSNMRLDLLDFGYSTAARNGGLYACAQGGALCLLLAYAADARHIVFLDDDNWAAPDHLQRLLAANQGFDWAYTLRWLADGERGVPLCLDEWESVGPARGAFAQSTGGFVDLNCLMMDKLACHFAIPWLSGAMYRNGNGHDRLLFRALVDRHSIAWTGYPTLFYTLQEQDSMNRHRVGWLASKGVKLPFPVTASA